MHTKTVLVGIAGGSGSGKTELARILKRHYGDDLSVLCYDNYYKERHNLTLEERKLLNLDEPAAFDNALLRQHLLLLKRGMSIQCPVYDYFTFDRANYSLEINHAPIIVVDGFLLLAVPEIRSILDIKIYIDVDADIRVLRCIERDMEERNMPVKNSIEHYLRIVRPMHLLHVEPSKKYADIIIEGGGRNPAALARIVSRINGILAPDIL